ncbi:MAG: 23S rRNA (adenine(2503)-C(2))-methyltransferase [Nitrospirae bacterium 13_1_20CM_2_62_14]|nr:MAG: 23S rRNA (adenine(2503)-C(2))-methyltransferase [Nitrospirae bacterium 13_1_20CM_2_62_14]
MARSGRPPASPHGAGTNLLELDLKSAERLVRDLGWPRYRAPQIFRWLYQSRVRDIERMTDLSQAERARLRTMATIERLHDCHVLTSADGTRKFLARLEDGLMVESVLIPEDGRLTLCLSTQVGCTLDCGFCLTGRMGLKRNLKAHEIVDQVLMVQDRLESGERLTNLVLMGMGEPLANLDGVTEAIARLTDTQWGVGIPARRITLSTAGLAPRLKEVATLGINLAVSLNATTNEQRDRLMPAINRLHPLNSLLAACRAYPLPPRRRLTFEYVLLAGINDTEQDARRLVKLLSGMRCKVNLIPFNEFPDSGFRRPEESAVLRFQSVLRKAGLHAFIRKSKGRDVLGACGQLGQVPERREAAILTPVGA